MKKWLKEINDDPYEHSARLFGISCLISIPVFVLIMLLIK